MKKILSIAVAAILSAGMAFAALPASAASGVDIVDTFESYYGKKDLIASTWKTDGCFKGNISTDTQASAPERGNGKDKGNYRSMKASFNFTTDTWGSIRDMTEDSYALMDAINGNKDANFTFYAKADKAMTIMAEVDIKDCPFYGKVQLTTSWKKYTLNLRSLTPELKDKNGNLTGIYDRNAQQAWGNGKEEPFLVGFKFQLNKDDNANLSNGTIWIDTLAFEGSTIVERSEDNTQDKSGTVPSDFKAESTTSTGSTGGTTGGSTTGGSSASNSATGSKTTTTSTNSDGSTVEVDENGSVVTDSSDDTSSVTDESGDASSNNSSDDSSEDSSDDSSEKTKKGGLSTGAKVAIAVGIVVVLAGGGAAVYFFVIKKKKEQE